MKTPLHIKFNQEDALAAIEFGDIYIRFNDPNSSQVRIFGEMCGLKENSSAQTCVLNVCQQLIKQININETHFENFTAIGSYKNKDILLYRCAMMQEVNSPVIILRTLFFTDLNQKEIKNYILAIEEKERFEKIITNNNKETKIFKL